MSASPSLAAAPHLTLVQAAFSLAVLVLSHNCHADVFEVGADGALSVRAADRGHEQPALPGAADLTAKAVAAPSAWQPVLARISRQQSVHPALLEALVWQESRWRPDAVSPKGAIGLAQLMPATARDLGIDPREPVANLEGGARYLRQQIDRFGNLHSALAAYNAGPQRVLAAGGVPDIAETREYVAAVMRRFRRSLASEPIPSVL